MLRVRRPRLYLYVTVKGHAAASGSARARVACDDSSGPPRQMSAAPRARHPTLCMAACAMALTARPEESQPGTLRGICIDVLCGICIDVLCGICTIYVL